MVGAEPARAEQAPIILKMVFQDPYFPGELGSGVR
jgi:hypothetical protein